MSCDAEEFECNYPADGCIPWSKVYDGVVDCLRDGADEAAEAKKMAALEKFPEGKNTLCTLISH